MAGEDTIEINEDRGFQRREWRFERVGWTMMALVVAAALLGVFGYGPLSHATVGDPATLALDYDRVQRASAPAEYRFRAARALTGDGEVRLRFDSALTEEMELDSIMPEPREVRSGPGYTEFAFATAAGDEPATIMFEFRPATFGHVRGRVTSEGAPPLLFDQYILP